jgi:subtilisin family serine protease
MRLLHWKRTGSCVNTQDGDDDPLEVLDVTNLGYKLVECTIKVKNRNGAAARKTLELFIYPESGTITYIDNINPVDSIFGHPAVPDVIAVGAIAADDPGNDDIEFFSSQGPVTISYPSATKRPKPDLCGIDGVSVTGAGGFPSPFYGTSASAPHIAAIAAQIWGAFPDGTSDAIRNALYKSAVDLGTSGYDTIFGYGRADALAAIAWIKLDIRVEPVSFDKALQENTSEDYMLN